MHNKKLEERSCEQDENEIAQRHARGQVRSGLDETASSSAPTQGTQGILRLPAPHKIFLWNAKGVYVDCAFPNPVHGHFLGGDKIIGTSLSDAFAQPTSQRILQGLREALMQQDQQEVIIDLQRGETLYQAILCLFPMDQHVMGWVTDHLARRCADSTSGERSAPLLSVHESLLMMLTHQEKAVIKAFGPGQTNRWIADTLGISERMVQFHMYNLLHKLKLPSRARLAHLRFFETNLINS